MDRAAWNPRADEELDQVGNELDQLAAAYRSARPAGATNAASRLLGRGSGLTPSGDDVIIGFLLALRRILSGAPVLRPLQTSQENDPDFEIQANFYKEASLRIVELSRQKTTWLAAGLIESAADGQADERLVTALDGILSGSLPPDECTRRLLSYGSSSGGDTWLGVGLAFGL